VWDVASATEVIPAISVQSGSGDAMWSPDDRYIASWSLDERALRLWDAQTGAEFQQIPTESSLLGAAWSPDSAHILYWTGNDMAHMWDVEAGNERLSLSHVTRRAELRADDNDISTGLWSADGSRILTSTVYGDVRIWDAETGVELKAIDECGGFVSWNADETLLLCARDLSANDGVSVWDVDTGEPILEYPLDIEGQFDGVAWSADDRRILAWTILDAKTFVWVADVQELVEIGQRRTYRELTDEERARFFLPPAS
jgi:WD40 repeat protein